MLSDGSLVSESLKKCTCANCGLVQHVDAKEKATIQQCFGPAYALGDHRPNLGFEGARQKLYAQWITDSLGTYVPGSILELGCGNGALLAELATKFTSSKTVGLESSDRAVTQARQSGLNVHQVYIDDADSIKAFSADLIISINVVEHVLSPLAFMRATKAAVHDGGLVLLICPDGSAAGSELLIFDHLFSFCPSNLINLMRSAGLEPVRHRRSPPGLPGFQMVIAATTTDSKQILQEYDPRVDVHELHTHRASYLMRWQQLDARLCHAMEGCRRALVFGVGEMAQLIRAYAPSSWARIDSFTVDDPLERMFFGRPVIPYVELKTTQHDLVILAVSPHSASRLATRLCAAGHNVLAIEDLYSGCER